MQNNIWNLWANQPPFVSEQPLQSAPTLAKWAVLAGFIEQLLDENTAHQWPKAIQNWLTHPSADQTQLAAEAVLNQRKEAVAQWLAAWSQGTVDAAHAALETATAGLFRWIEQSVEGDWQVARLSQVVGAALPELRVSMPLGLRHTLQSSRIKWETPSVSDGQVAGAPRLGSAPLPLQADLPWPQRVLPWLILGGLALGVLLYAKRQSLKWIGEAPQAVLIDSLALPNAGQGVYVEVSDSLVIQLEAGSFLAQMALAARQSQSQTVAFKGQHFEAVGGDVSAASQRVLDSLALVLTAYPSAFVQVEVPLTTAELGTDKRLWAAKMVDYLIKKGIDANRLGHTTRQVPTLPAQKVTDVQEILFQIKK